MNDPKELGFSPIPSHETTARNIPDRVIRFPAPKTSPVEPDDILPRWQHLLPKRWMRRVIIQGKQFWLPG